MFTIVTLILVPVQALFCFALALLRLNESKLLRLHDPVNLLQYLKNMSRHTFDIEPMFQVCVCGEGMRDWDEWTVEGGREAGERWGTLSGRGEGLGCAVLQCLTSHANCVSRRCSRCIQLQS